MIKIGLAAGFLKTPAHIDAALLNSASAFTTFGGVTAADRPGNPEPRTYAFPDKTKYVNAVNLENKGAPDVAKFIIQAATAVHAADKGFRVNLTPTVLGSLRAMLSALNIMPWSSHIDLYEINVACPNHKDGDQLHAVLAHDPSAIRDVLAESIEFGGPFALKIAPDTTDETLRAIVDLCAEFNVKQITSGNTERIKTPIVDGKPVLHKSITHCGLSGTPLVEGNLRQVDKLCTLIVQGGHDMTVSACGGILSGEVLRRYENVGASEGQVAAGYAMFGARIFSDIYQGYAEAA